MLQFLKLGHGKLIAKMALEQFVGDESFWSVALGIDKGHMVIDVAYSLQLVRVSMMVRAAIDANQENCDMY